MLRKILQTFNYNEKIIKLCVFQSFFAIVEHGQNGCRSCRRQHHASFERRVLRRRRSIPRTSFGKNIDLDCLALYRMSRLEADPHGLWVGLQPWRTLAQQLAGLGLGGWAHFSFVDYAQLRNQLSHLCHHVNYSEEKLLQFMWSLIIILLTNKMWL